MNICKQTPGVIIFSQRRKIKKITITQSFENKGK
jgi:hypothetical protein